MKRNCCLIIVLAVLTVGLCGGCGNEMIGEKDRYISSEQTDSTDYENKNAELVGKNAYFYMGEETFLHATAKYRKNDWVEKDAYIQVDMLQAYENGCVYRLTVDIDEDDFYLEKDRLNYIFYVTEDIIYQVPSSIDYPSEGLVYDFYDDIDSLTEMFDTDEKLAE